MTKRRKSDELDAALRAEPDYQELVRLLKRQAPAQKTRTERWLTEQAEEEEGAPMPADKKALDERIIALRDEEHLSWSKIAARLEAEGFPAMKDQAVRKRYERAEKSHPSQHCEPQEPPPAPAEVSQPSPIPAAWIPHLRALVREELRSRAKPVTAPTIPDLTDDSPPQRPRKGRKMRGKKETLPGLRVDVVLLDLFDQARKQWGLSASETMERLLWIAFRRPKLSYEKDTAPGRG